MVRDNYTAGLTYYHCHANRVLGHANPDFFTSLPTSSVYFKDGTDIMSVVACNLDACPRFVDVVKGDKKIGGFIAPSGSLVRQRELLRVSSSPRIVATMPEADAKDLHFPKTEVVHAANVIRR